MISYIKSKQFNVQSFDNCIQIRTNHPLWNRIRMAWGLIVYGCFEVVAPTKNTVNGKKV